MRLVYALSNCTATTVFYTLSLHDALPISCRNCTGGSSRRTVWPSISACTPGRRSWATSARRRSDRKSTRLNSSHLGISYAVFCLKKKKKNRKHIPSHTQSQKPEGDEHMKN